MDELYNLCSKCNTVTIEYAKILQQDKEEFKHDVSNIVEQYRNEINCTNTWYAMALDITRLVKKLGYGYSIELLAGVLHIEVCTTSIVL